MGADVGRRRQPLGVYAVQWDPSPWKDDLFGAVGAFQSEHRVYAREGLPCVRCRKTVVRHKWSGRSTFLCGACQV